MRSFNRINWGNITGGSFMWLGRNLIDCFNKQGGIIIVLTDREEAGCDL